MLDMLGDSPETNELIERVFPTDAVTGRLVMIGPTTRENGLPNGVDEMENMASMWVGWVPVSEIPGVLAKLQSGNPERLAVYAVGKATLAEVAELKRTLGLAGAKLWGNWFRIWTPLTYIVKVLRGDAE